MGLGYESPGDSVRLCTGCGVALVLWVALVYAAADVRRGHVDREQRSRNAPRPKWLLFCSLCPHCADRRRRQIGRGTALQRVFLEVGVVWPRVVRATAANQLRMRAHETAPFQSSRLVALVGTGIRGCVGGSARSRLVCCSANRREGFGPRCQCRANTSWDVGLARLGGGQECVAAWWCLVALGGIVVGLCPGECCAWVEWQ